MLQRPPLHLTTAVCRELCAICADASRCQQLTRNLSSPLDALVLIPAFGYVCKQGAPVVRAHCGRAWCALLTGSRMSSVHLK